MKPRSVRILVFCLGLTALVSCSQANQANQHLGSMDQTSRQMLDELRKSEKILVSATRHMETIAEALVSLKDMGLDIVKLLQSTFAPKPPAPTDDIDGVLNSSGESDDSR